MRDETLAGGTTFAEWLARMQKNMTTIGDLARYLASLPSWASVENNRLAILAYLDAQGASKEILSAFSHAWGNYKIALKRAQDAQETAQTSRTAQGEQAPRIAQAREIPAPAPGRDCQQCGAPGAQEIDIPGIGAGVLCRSCLQAVIEKIRAALGGGE